MIYGVAGAIGAITAVNYAAPYLMRFGNLRTIRQRSAREPSLVLTYDDGPGKELTPKLLDLLASYNAKATFFALGRAVHGSSSILDRVVAEGHELGSHSQDHLHAWKTLPWRSSIDAWDGLYSLGSWLPSRPLFRPPYGKTTLSTWLLMRSRGAQTVWWTLDSGDTHLILPRPESITQSMINAGGGVVLLHDFDRSKERNTYVVETTEQLLNAAKSHGIGFKTFSELLSGNRRTSHNK